MNSDLILTLYNDIKNKEGGTIGEHKRFIVSISNNIINELTLNELEKTISRFKDTAKTLNLLSYCFGFWKNDNKVFLDLNISVENEATALSVAYAFNQKAIWDSHNLKEILFNIS